MEDPRSTARSSVQQFVAAWLAGDFDTVSQTCSATVQWWSPVSPEAAGPAEACAALESVLAPVPRPIEVTGLLVNEDGTRSVVEMRSPARAQDGPSTFVTSVIGLTAGEIAEGRTYIDVKAYQSEGATT